MITLRKPNLYGKNEKEKVEELGRSINILVDDIQYALEYLEDLIKTTNASTTETTNKTEE